MPYRSVNPANGEVLKTFTEHTDEQMLAALDAAACAFRAWSPTSIAERSAVMHNAAKLMVERKEALARLVTLEMGKLIAASRGAERAKMTFLEDPHESTEGGGKR